MNTQVRTPGAETNKVQGQEACCPCSKPYGRPDQQHSDKHSLPELLTLCSQPAFPPLTLITNPDRSLLQQQTKPTDPSNPHSSYSASLNWSTVPSITKKHPCQILITSVTISDPLSRYLFPPNQAALIYTTTSKAIFIALSGSGLQDSFQIFLMLCISIISTYASH